MSINKLFIGLAVGLVFVASFIAILGLAHELTSGAPPDLLIHSLELWVSQVAYRMAIILLAAAGVCYLVNKK